MNTAAIVTWNWLLFHVLGMPNLIRVGFQRTHNLQWRADTTRQAFGGGSATFPSIQILRWLAVALGEAVDSGTILALTSGPEPTAYHALSLVFFSPVDWVFWGWYIPF